MKFIKKEELYNNTSNVEIHKEHGFVIKYIDYGNLSDELLLREVYWLKKLEYSNIAPKVIEYSRQNLSIKMNYCGDILSEANKPHNVYEQLYDIHIILLQNNCMYNDWKHGNVLVNDGKITLIDFGWCPHIIEDYSCSKNIATTLEVKPGGGNFFENIFREKNGNKIT